jgi:hypothetical protein
VAGETAKVVRFESVGGPEVLKIREETIPKRERVRFAWM